MMRSVGVVTLLLIGAAPASLPAQERPPRPRMVIEGQEARPFDLLATRRARLGVTLDMRAVDNDSIGATIASVTPSGPAAKAGLQSGDIITKLNGRSLVRGQRDRDEDEEQSLAALRLVEMVARLEPGDTVAVEYRRGREVKTARVITARERDVVVSGRFDWSEEPDQIVRLRTLPRMNAVREPGAFFLQFGGPMAEIELAPLNEDLGAYFGTTDGVLVVSAPAANPFGLKGGDVILSVDGRKPRGPSSLHRILATYEEGDVVKLEIMRNKARQTISSKVERKDE